VKTYLVSLLGPARAFGEEIFTPNTPLPIGLAGTGYFTVRFSAPFPPKIM
jgi:hypothetical protein